MRRPTRSPEETIRRAQEQQRNWLLPPVVVADEDFVSAARAAEVIRSARGGPSSVSLLVARGILQPCFTADAREGVTAESLAAEVEWRNTASPWRRFTRAVGGFIHWI